MLMKNSVSGSSSPLNKKKKQNERVQIPSESSGRESEKQVHEFSRKRV